MTPPDTTSATILAEIVHRADAHITRIAELELEELDTANQLDAICQQMRAIEIQIIVQGLPGSNDRTRQAELDAQLHADPDWTRLDQARALKQTENKLATLRATDHKRRLALLMELIRARRGVE